MKANELRIGNLLRDKVSKTELKVTGLNESDILTYVIDRSKFPLKDGWAIEPIPLTEEQLLKFGFEKLNTMMSGCFVFQKGLWRVAIKDNIEKTYDWVLWHERISPPTWCLSRFKYVHQIQNIYFSLTDEELEVK